MQNVMLELTALFRQLLVPLLHAGL